MSYCLNPNCQVPQNLDAVQWCQNCGTLLQLQGRYQASRLISQRHQCRTFLAFDQISSRPVMCIIQQFNLSNSAQHLTVFNQASRTLKKLGKHPQIPALLDFFPEAGYFYWIQEFIEGSNLTQVLITEGGFSESKILQLLESLLTILQFIHTHQVIHRDINPKNILFNSDKNQWFLVNFSTAKLDPELDLIIDFNNFGSAEYTALEQIQGKTVFASDLYSLGVTCLYLLTEVSPFDLFDATHNRWIWRHYLSHPDSTNGSGVAQAIVSPISSQLSQILDRLIEPMVSRRFQSADEVLEMMGILGLQTQRNTLIYPTIKEPQNSVNFWPQWHCYNTIHTASPVHSITMSSQGQLLASGHSDQTLKLWHLETGEPQGILSGHTHAVQSVDFHPNGVLLASGSDDKTIKFWNVETLTEICTLIGHSQFIKSIHFSPDGQLLASGSWDKTIKIWGINPYQEIQNFIGHKLLINAVHFSVDSEFLASGSFDKTIRVWSIKSRTDAEILSEHQGSVLAIAFSPDGQWFATGSDDKTIKLWNLKTRKVIHTLSRHTWSVVSLVFTPDSQTLISGSWDHTIKLWQVSTGIEIETLVGHSDSVCAVDIHPSGHIIASGSRDQTIKLWHL